MIFSAIFTIIWLTLFEVINSIDNAIINAEVLHTMWKKARRWFLIWGMFIAVFMVRWLLPWLIIWATAPQLWPIWAFTATFSNDTNVKEIIEAAAPILLLGWWVFLMFLFFHWLFLEEKNFWLPGERFFNSKWIWFYAVVSIILTIIVWKALHTKDPIFSFWAVVGSTVFFITHGFKQSAEENEKKLMKTWMSDISKILYLEVIDATFSIDWVLGAFAFTLSVPLILLWNWIWAFVVREITISNIERIKKYKYLKNWAMYSILFLWMFMILNWFWMHIPEYIAPIITFAVVGFFFLKSSREIKKESLKDLKNLIN